MTNKSDFDLKSIDRTNYIHCWYEIALLIHFFFFNFRHYIWPQTPLAERGLSTGTPVQQPEEQMDCGAATSDPSDDTTLSQVNKQCHCIWQLRVKDGARCDARATCRVCFRVQSMERRSWVRRRRRGRGPSGARPRGRWESGPSAPVILMLKENDVLKPAFFVFGQCKFFSFIAPSETQEAGASEARRERWKGNKFDLIFLLNLIVFSIFFSY